MDCAPTIIQHSRLLEIIDKHVQQSVSHDRIAGFILCDIKRFSSINEIHGYEVGDAVLYQIYQRLEEIVRADDCIARNGANEFALILPFLANPFVANLAVQKVLAALNEPIEVSGKSIRLHPVAGVGLANQKDPDAENLCLITEKALKEAKKTSKPFCILHSDDKVHSADADMESALEQAIENDELELYCQPKIAIDSGIAVSCEMLIRWKRDGGDYVSPGIFIPFAEQTGLIQPITRWTLHNSLRQLKNMPKKWENVTAAVNISGACFQQDNLVDEVNNALKIWSVDPKRLILEVTETVFMQDLESTGAICRALRNDIGVQISIDDFGTGFSSMEYFKHIPADELKIDRSFISAMYDEKKDRHIVEMVTKLAQGLGLRVVVEGIEDHKTLALAAEIGCDYAQGYFISVPVSEKDFVTWLETYSRAVPTRYNT